MDTRTDVLLLDELRQRCGGKAKTMVRVLESFISISHDYIAKVQQPELLTDLATLAKTLHAIKGLLREIAVAEGASYVETVETKLKAQQPVSAEDLHSVALWIHSARVCARTAEQELRKEI